MVKTTSNIIMSEFQQFEQDINKMLEDSNQFIDKLKGKNIQGMKKEQAIEQLETRISDIGDQIDMAQNEYNCTRDPLMKKEWKPILEEMKLRHKDLQQEVISLKQKPKSNLVTDEDDQDQEEEIQKVQANDLQKVQIASILYQDAHLHLDDADRNLDEIVDINDTITGQLEQDTLKLNRINDELVGMKAENQIAKRQLAQLAQRVSSNKCYIAIFFAIVVVIFGFTIWDLVKTVQK